MNSKNPIKSASVFEIFENPIRIHEVIFK